MEKQEIFDKVYRHLIRQGTVSEHGIQCAYRGPEGLKCAAGCLIEDDEYDSAFEGCHWSISEATFVLDMHRSKEAYAKFEAMRRRIGHRNFVRELQVVHDTVPPNDWTLRLGIIANTHGLTIPSLLDEKACTSGG